MKKNSLNCAFKQKMKLTKKKDIKVEGIEKVDLEVETDNPVVIV